MANGDTAGALVFGHGNARRQVDELAQPRLYCCKCICPDAPRQYLIEEICARWPCDFVTRILVMVECARDQDVADRVLINSLLISNSKLKLGWFCFEEHWSGSSFGWAIQQTRDFFLSIDKNSVRFTSC